MKTDTPLKSGTGMLAQIGLREELLRYLRPQERLVVAPVRWIMPPWSLSFPNRCTDAQYEFLAAVSDRGLHVWMHRWTGDRYTIADHEFRGYDGLSALKAGATKRALGGWRRRAEEVVLLQLWDGGGGMFACESRYRVALDQATALRDGIAAVKGSGENTSPNMTAVEEARLLSDELGRLADLFQSGAITADEWSRAKDAYLGPSPDSRAASLDEVEKLYRLYTAGAISKYEYERKKLELLTW